jgi:hypothetical protein
MAKHTRQVKGDPWDFSEPGRKVSWPYRKWYNTHIARRTRYAVPRESFDRPLKGMIAQEKDAVRRMRFAWEDRSGGSVA